MLLRYSYRPYPTPGQRAALARAFGCARVVFNDALAARQAAHKAGEPYITDAAMSAALTASKDSPERAWLSGVSSVVLQQALADLNQAVYVEDLAVRGLARTRLAKSVHDAGWAAFTAMLEYKAKLHGRAFRKIGGGNRPARSAQPAA